MAWKERFDQAYQNPEKPHHYYYHSNSHSEAFNGMGAVMKQETKGYQNGTE